MIANGWTLLFHPALADPLQKLSRATERVRKTKPEAYSSSPSVKLLGRLTQFMQETIPADPGRPEYRQGNTLGPEYRHWFRAKFMGRFRLFFRYDSGSKIIVYAWVNDETTLRKAGGKHDPYEVFRRMLKAGNPPNDWAALVKVSPGDYPA